MINIKLLLIIFCLIISSNAKSQTELILNGNFSGTSSWTTTGDFYYNCNYNGCGLSCYSYASSPTGVASNNLSGELYQFVNIPSNTSSANLHFQYCITTSETTSSSQYDVCYIGIFDQSNNLVVSNSLSNLNASGLQNFGPIPIPSSLFGQTVKVRFSVITNSSNPTTFRFDNVSIVAMTANQTGSVNVSLNPSEVISASAMWNIDNGPWKTSGSTANNVSTGSHTINFNSLSGWNSPNAQTITVSSNNTTNASGTYTIQNNNQVGSVKVTLTPIDAINAGAMWNIDNGTWQTSGTTINNVITGNHTINFNSVSGWNSPNTQTITVSSNNTTNASGTYTIQNNNQLGSVKVTLIPIGAINAGAMWNIDNGSWQTSGTTINNVTTGNHTINFNSVTGWNSPNAQTITVNSNNTTNASGTYTIQNNNQVGSVKVTIYPIEAINAGAMWKLDNGNWQESQTIINNINLGNHTIIFKPIANYTTPNDISILVSNNNLILIDETYQITQQTSNLYKLPFPSGTQYICSQGNNTNSSHNATSKDRYAFDFSMNEGTLITAARGGKVKQVVSGYSQHFQYPNCTQSQYSLVNRIIIDHQDGTYGLYLHLKENGSLVAYDQDVLQGEPIGYSGNTGCTSNPHLHFMVMNGSWYSQSIPINFCDYPENIGVPQSNTLCTSLSCNPNATNNQIENALIHPNPANTYLNVIFNQNVNSVSSYMIVNSAGSIVQNSTSFNFNSIDISNLNFGIYFIQFNTNIGVIVKRFIKN